MDRGHPRGDRGLRGLIGEEVVCDQLMEAGRRAAVALHRNIQGHVRGRGQHGAPTEGIPNGVASACSVALFV